MGLVLDALMIGIPSLLLVLGWSRGIQREALTLCGILLGALLAQWWAPVWAQNNTLFNQDPATLQVLFAGGMLLFSTIFLGYGGALLLPSRRVLAQGSNRIYGALLGGLNGLFIIGLLFRYSLARFSGFSRVYDTRFGPLLADKLPLIVLWGVLGATALVLFRITTKTLVRLHNGPKKQQEYKKYEPQPISKKEPLAPKPPLPHTVDDPILRDLLSDEYRNK